VHIADRLDDMETAAPGQPHGCRRKRRFQRRSLCADAGRRRAGREAAVFGTRAPEAVRKADVSGTGRSRHGILRDQCACHRSRQQACAGHCAAKGSLLVSLGKRLMPAKKAKASGNARSSIPRRRSTRRRDAAEAANEPLEPGSGAPDVKKILERVRASQNAARTNPKPASDTDRADYIAAARRAAQAAAMEVDAGAKAGSVKGEKKAKIKDPAKGSAFSRFRRPILLAVGAVLLAIMAFPLARTLTSGAPAPALKWRR
jgi:localization factor PodJL